MYSMPFCVRSSATLDSCSVTGNSAPLRTPSQGGGIYAAGNSSLALSRTAVVGNAALQVVGHTRVNQTHING